MQLVGLWLHEKTGLSLYFFCFVTPPSAKLKLHHQPQKTKQKKTTSLHLRLPGRSELHVVPPLFQFADLFTQALQQRLGRPDHHGLVVPHGHVDLLVPPQPGLQVADDVVLDVDLPVEELDLLPRLVVQSVQRAAAAAQRRVAIRLRRGGGGGVVHRGLRGRFVFFFVFLLLLFFLSFSNPAFDTSVYGDAT